MAFLVRSQWQDFTDLSLNIITTVLYDRKFILYINSLTLLLICLKVSGAAYLSLGNYNVEIVNKYKEITNKSNAISLFY